MPLTGLEPVRCCHRGIFSTTHGYPCRKTCVVARTMSSPCRFGLGGCRIVSTPSGGCRLGSALPTKYAGGCSPNLTASAWRFPIHALLLKSLASAYSATAAFCNLLCHYTTNSKWRQSKGNIAYIGKLSIPAGNYPQNSDINIVRMSLPCSSSCSFGICPVNLELTFFPLPGTAWLLPPPAPGFGR